MATLSQILAVTKEIGDVTRKSDMMSNVNRALNQFESFGIKLMKTSGLDLDEQDVLGAILNNYVSPAIEKARRDFKRGKLNRE
jgi:hypothetical protein